MRGFTRKESLQAIDEQLLNYIDLMNDSDDPDIIVTLSDEINKLNIRKQVYSCEKCLLNLSCKSAVPFIGDKDTTGRGFGVVALQANPTAEDEAAGEPFTGKNGALLHRAFKSVGIHVDGFLSAASCSSPRNRVPTDRELKMCRDNLVAQIEYLDPWLIICFGAAPLKACLVGWELDRKINVKDDHGIFFRSKWPEIHPNKAIWAVGVSHPFVLSNSHPDARKGREEFVHDLKHISAVIECREELGGNVIESIMGHAMIGAPYVPGKPMTTKELKTTYLQKMEMAEKEAKDYNYGLDKEAP